MKTKLLGGFVAVWLAAAASAQTTNLTALLQRGLFAEQATRDLDAAITDYTTLAAQFDKDRQIAATAVFRLGECYRAQGKTNEAAAHYQRILKDFSDQQTLATLSRQNLTGMGAVKNETAVANVPSENPDAALLKKLEAMPSEVLEKVLPTVLPDATLEDLLSKRNDAQTKRTALLVDYPPSHLQVVRVDAQLEELKKQVAEKISGMMQGLKLRSELPVASVSKKVERTTSIGFGQYSEDDEIRSIETMLQNSPDLVNAPYQGASSPLNKAAENGWLKVATYLIEHGADVNGGNGSALISAASCGNRAMAELLLSRGANVNSKDGDGKTPLHLAAEKKFVAVVQVLLANKADVNSLDGNRFTPLVLAAQKGAVAVAATLLAQGADPNILCGRNPVFGNRTPTGTALHFAVTRGGEAIMALLLTNRADVTLRNQNGESALDLAASRNWPDMAEQLIAAGADVNAVGSDNQGGLTPLHRAASVSREMVAMLLEHGANPNTTQAKSGRTPLMDAVNNNKPEIASLLLQHKANPNPADGEGYTALQFAVMRGNTATVRALLASGANPNTLTSWKMPLLVEAVADERNGNQEIVAAFIDAKADVNAPDAVGSTALHYAAQKDRKDLVELLVKAGADVNLRAKDGRTPLDFSKSATGKNGGVAYIAGVRLASTGRPPGVPAAAGNSSSDETATTNEMSVVEFLRAHGALDALPDFTRIRITRQGLAQPLEVFTAGKNVTNRFTLLETVMRFYSREVWIGNNGRAAWERLPFPNFGRVIIRRPGAKIGGKETEIKVSLLNRSNVVDCAQDVPVQFGDVIEIPESVHALNAVPPNPVREMEDVYRRIRPGQILNATNTRSFLAIQTMVESDTAKTKYWVCLQKSVQLVVAGETTSFKVNSWKEGFLNQALEKTEARSALRSSSDLSRVKVTRKTGSSSRPEIFTVDVSDQAQSENYLWLQDGDVIEVPEK